MRILGRENDLDTIEELSGIKVLTAQHIFHVFVKYFVELYLHKYVYMPNGSEMCDVMNMYKIMGFNGCIDSIDCTYIVWNKCLNNFRNYCIGKGKNLTFSFQVVVSHDRRVL